MLECLALRILLYKNLHFRKLLKGSKWHQLETGPDQMTFLNASGFLKTCITFMNSPTVICYSKPC